MTDFFIYLLILAGSTYLIRAVPFALVKKSIKSIFVKSFLSYIPYAVLVAMTIPSAFYATGNLASSVIGLFVGGVFAFRGKGLTFVAVVSCATALLVDLALMLT
jgi:branched-subunit amino acid transport protein